MAGGFEHRPPTSQHGGWSLPVPNEWLDVLADAVAQRLGDAQSEHSSPWLTRQQLADRLGVPLSRIEKDRTIPCHRWEGRVLYHRDEVDQWLLDKGPR
jgi:hypothetical protein